MRQKAVYIKATTKIDPITKEGRIAIANMITRQFDLWKLDLQDQLSLLGLSRNSRATLMRYRNGAPIANSRDPAVDTQGAPSSVSAKQEAFL